MDKENVLRARALPTHRAESRGKMTSRMWAELSGDLTCICNIGVKGVLWMEWIIWGVGWGVIGRGRDG